MPSYRLYRVKIKESATGELAKAFKDLELVVTAWPHSPDTYTPIGAWPDTPEMYDKFVTALMPSMLDNGMPADTLDEAKEYLEDVPDMSPYIDRCDCDIIAEIN